MIAMKIMVNVTGCDGWGGEQTIWHIFTKYIPYKLAYVDMFFFVGGWVLKYGSIMPNKTLFKASLLMGNGERASIQGRSIIDFESSEVQGLHCIEKQILNWGSNILLVENPKIEKVGDYCFLAHKNLAEKVRKSRHKNFA